MREFRWYKSGQQLLGNRHPYRARTIHSLKSRQISDKREQLKTPGRRPVLIAPKLWLKYPTTTFERFLLIITYIILPLQDHLPAIAGYSIMYLWFGVLAVYVLLCRHRSLARAWMHPVFLAAYALLFLGVLIESFHPHSSYIILFRSVQMVIGAIVIASICRDRRALRASIYGYLIAAIWMSILLFLTSYSVIHRTKATDFNSASKIRAEAFRGAPLQANLNSMAAVAAQGAIVGLALALTSRKAYQRKLFFALAIFCLVGSFMPMSRGGFAILLVSCGIIMYASKIGYGKIIFVAGIIFASAIIWVPEAVWSRMFFSTEAHHGYIEGRARVYTAAIEHLSEYVITGVGSGNFWTSWGFNSRFASGSSGHLNLLAAHNLFVQVTIFWGLPALLALIVLVWQGYRCLPKHCGTDPLSLCMLGIAVAVLVLSMFISELYSKDFSLALGGLVGARLWVWPQGRVQSFSRVYPTNTKAAV
jgi:hypothetical protein